MLETLLKLIAQGGIHSYQDLTERLNITQPLLEAMVEDLVRLGYLNPAGDRCSGTCSSCSIGSCTITGPGRIWSLTERGAKAAARL